jgi:hypothetical protein
MIAAMPDTIGAALADAIAYRLMVRRWHRVVGASLRWTDAERQNIAALRELLRVRSAAKRLAKRGLL